MAEREKTAMERCPRFISCSAAVCPLDPEMGLQIKHGPKGEDKALAEDEVCTLGRAKRLELGGSLARRGLWPRELAAVKYQESLSEEDRRQWAARNENVRFRAASGS